VTEPEYAWFHRPDAPLIAVIGSNGKSTTTVLIAEMLKASGVSSAAGGNLGPAASQLVLDGGWESWVLEMSSFQTELLTAMAPRVGVFLNLSQDHLERHANLNTYRDAKRRLFAFQTAAATAVLNADDTNVRTTPTEAQRVFFSLIERSDGWLDGSVLTLGDTPLVDRSELSLAGLHNSANALAAALAARQLGASDSAMSDTLKSFGGLEHRHCLVAEIDGVRWVNDSKATNVGATKAALEGYEAHSVHLILGGLAKGQDFSPLRESIRHHAIRVYLIGADRAAIAHQLADTVALDDCVTLDRAVSTARFSARSGETVLLAPACASFDQFSGYAERGAHFSELVLAEEVAPCR
jgi:UDP-N-acetylmuramoylalanine--D-glutamate ligase